MNIFICLFALFSFTFSQPNSYLREVEVDGFTTIFSHGYPQLLQTTTRTVKVKGNNSLETDVTEYVNPFRLDWKLTSKAQTGLLFFFDRLGLDAADQFWICSESQYLLCLRDPSSCLCVDVTREVDSVYWNATQGPAFVLLVYGVSKQFDSGIKARGGFRGKVIEVADKYHDCGTTKDISSMRTPYYMISSGYPFSAGNQSKCDLLVTATSGIRVRVYFLIPVDGYLMVAGTNPNGTFTNTTFTNEVLFGGIPTLYFRQNVTLSTLLMGVTDDLTSCYIVAIDSYDIAATMACDQYDDQSIDQELTIWTSGHSYLEDTIRPYFNNAECNYKITITQAYQMFLEIIGMNLEENADFFYAPDFNQEFVNGIALTGLNSYSLHAGVIGLKEANIKWITDGLGVESGGIVNVLLADCTCTGGVFDLTTDASSKSFANPVKKHDDFTYSTYCRGMECIWTFLVDPKHLTTLNVTDVDLGYFDVFQVETEKGPWGKIDRWGSYGFTNFSNVTLVLSSSLLLSDEFKQEDLKRRGVNFNVKSEVVIPKTIDLCNLSITKIDENASPMLEQEFIITSCKTPLAIYAKSYDESTLQIFDGDLDNGLPMKIETTMIITQNKLSIRITKGDPFATRTLLYVSDSFVDQNHWFCGGFSQGSLNVTSPGCLLVYEEDEIDAITVARQSLPIYRGISIQPDDLIPSTPDFPLRLMTLNAKASFTFKIPENFAYGGSFSSMSGFEFISITEQPSLVVSPDYFDPTQKAFDWRFEVFCDFNSFNGKFTLMKPLGQGASLCRSDQVCWGPNDGMATGNFECDSALSYNASMDGTALILQ